MASDSDVEIGDCAVTRHVLMCEPSHFRIAYEINPWMHRANAVNGPVALEQWRALHTQLGRLGVRVELVAQAESLPDMTFAANAGVVLGKRFIPANFRFPERQPEAELFSDWFESAGYETVGIHLPHYWEGEGDVLDAGVSVVAGYRFRTEFRALDHLDEILGRSTTRLELADARFYHLDTCFCPLTAGRALYYPAAFSADARESLRALFDDLIAVPEGEALRFACNAVIAGEGVVVLNTGCPETERELERRGVAFAATPTSEFIKAGGSVKCLVLTLDSFGVSS